MYTTTFFENFFICLKNSMKFTKKYKKFRGGKYFFRKKGLSFHFLAAHRGKFVT